jgi:ribokinase
MDLVFRLPRMPEVGETIMGQEFLQLPGGKGANQAVAAARQGAEVHFVGAVGNDVFGQQALRSLAEEGIATDQVLSSATAASGVAGIFVDGGGANSIAIAPGANELLTVAQVEAAGELIASSDFLVCQLESPLESVRRAIEIARQHAVQVVFNPAPAQPLDDALLSLVDYLVVNETEATQLSGIPAYQREDAARAAEALRARGAGTVLLTMGELGVIVADGDGSRFTEAVRVEAIDSTAAGDTFVGSFTVALARGQRLDAAVTEAQYAAALTVTRIGAQGAIPTRDEVIHLMTQRRGLP